MVVSESLARRKWPGSDPVGQPIKIGDEVLTVVGVARSARSLAPGDPDAVELYRLAREADLTGLAIVARTAGPSAALASAFSTAANSVDPNFKPQVQLLKDQFEQSVRDVESGALAVSVLGVIALAVACLGVVGLVVVLGRATHEGNRNPSGPGRPVPSHRGESLPSVPGHPHRWPDPRRARRRRARPAAAARAVWLEHDRSHRLHQRHRPVHFRGRPCRAVAGEARSARRSAGGSSLRLIVSPM